MESRYRGIEVMVRLGFEERRVVAGLGRGWRAKVREGPPLKKKQLRSNVQQTSYWV